MPAAPKGFFYRLVRAANKENMVKSTLYILFVTISIYASNEYFHKTDTLLLSMSKTAFMQRKQQWLSHFEYRTPIGQTNPCMDSCIYGIVPLRTWVKISENELSQDSTLVMLQYSWQDGQTSIANYRMANMTYTLKQECGIDEIKGKHIGMKSIPLFCGLDILNIGLASIYAHSSNPYAKANRFIQIAMVVCDAGLTAGLFIPDKGIRNCCLLGWSIYKVSGFVFILSVNGNNKLAKTGYKFILN
jgi:hypothetical protein